MRTAWDEWSRTGERRCVAAGWADSRHEEYSWAKPPTALMQRRWWIQSSLKTLSFIQSLTTAGVQSNVYLKGAVRVDAAPATLLQLHLGVKILLVLLHYVRQVGAPATLGVVLLTVAVVMMVVLDKPKINKQIKEKGDKLLLLVTYKYLTHCKMCWNFTLWTLKFSFNYFSFYNDFKWILQHSIKVD